MTRTLVCQLWTNPEQGLLSGYSLHEDREILCPVMGGQTVQCGGRILRAEGDPYEVEVLDGDKRAQTSFFYLGLPAFTVVDPPGVRMLLSHLAWDEVCDKADGTWNAEQGLGRVQSGAPDWRRVSNRYMVATGWSVVRSYDELIGSLRREHGTYVVKLTEERGYRHALFARRTPEDLLDELQVAHVMES